jgi:hypothetical protein
VPGDCHRAREHQLLEGACPTGTPVRRCSASLPTTEAAAAAVAAVLAGRRQHGRRRIARGPGPARRLGRGPPRHLGDQGARAAPRRPGRRPRPENQAAAATAAAAAAAAVGLSADSETAVVRGGDRGAAFGALHLSAPPRRQDGDHCVGHGAGRPGEQPADRVTEVHVAAVAAVAAAAAGNGGGGKAGRGPAGAGGDGADISRTAMGFRRPAVSAAAGGDRCGSLARDGDVEGAGVLRRAAGGGTFQGGARVAGA